jgi:hypothetical protein
MLKSFFVVVFCIVNLKSEVNSFGLCKVSRSFNRERVTFLSKTNSEAFATNRASSRNETAKSGQKPNYQSPEIYLFDDYEEISIGLQENEVEEVNQVPRRFQSNEEVEEIQLTENSNNFLNFISESIKSVKSANTVDELDSMITQAKQRQKTQQQFEEELETQQWEEDDIEIEKEEKDSKYENYWKRRKG